ncbi:helical backbone metal receptor [Larkinella soli]|uniref:helical backbone metal receptor n=1 Tax=Larkinella soli TaxID=1770527 RepID=UPI000FFB0BC3|nr:helical backbone metal receptor [Larkinella soli]
MNLLPQPPRRIVSVVPSQTELLFDLGLDQEIVGVTKFCIHPADQVKSRTRVGGTKTLNLGRIHALKPDLILANKEENTREQIEELQRHYPVHVTDIATLSDALLMIRTVGGLVGRAGEGEVLADSIRQKFDSLLSEPASGQTVAYLIWRKPWMVAAGRTFIDAMLTAGGFRNAFSSRERYPEISEAELQAVRPDLIFLSSEPYPFQEYHRAELQAHIPDARVILVDGELFSWYGSRLMKTPDYLRSLRIR